MLGIAPAARLSRLVLPLVDRNAAEVLAELDAAIAEGAEVSQLVDQLLGYFRDVMTQTVGCDESQMLYALPKQRQEVRVLAIVQILDQTAARMRVSTQTRTLAEMAVVRVCHLADLDELAALISELKQSSGGRSLPAVKKNAITNTPPQRAGASPPPSPPPAVPVTAVEDDTARPESSSIPKSSSIEREVVAIATPSIAPSAVDESKDSSTPISTENVDTIWKKVLGSLSGMVADIAAEANKVSVDEKGRLVVSFSQDFHREICEKPGNRSRLESAIQTVCGQEVPLMFRAVARVDAAQPAASPRQTRRQQQAEVATQPFVRKAMELFDGDPSRLRYVPPND